MGFKCQRWTVANLLPIFFVLWVIGSIWILYCSLHLAYLLDFWRPEQPGQENVHDPAMIHRGGVQLVISQFLTLMLFTCFILAVSTDPGSVPEEPEWMLAKRNNDDARRLTTSEVKHSGAPRYCKWCECYKPDRCHHCRVCRSCILRMDHHCPWIANCVGFKNHKYFLLLVFYSLLACVFISCTMLESLNRALNEETTFMRRFLVVFGVTLSIMMSILLILFFILHLWLMSKATTTIEFCEKAYKRNGNASSNSIYNFGVYENVKAILGPNPLFWLVPFSLPPGTGLTFPHNMSEKPSKDKAFPGSSSASNVRPSEEKEPLKDRKDPVEAPAAQGQTPEVTGHQASVS